MGVYHAGTSLWLQTQEAVQEDSQFETKLGYLVSLRSDRATLWNSVSKKHMTLSMFSNFFCLFFLWNRGLNSDLHTCNQAVYCVSCNSSPFYSGYFGDGVSQTICLSWPWMAISRSQSSFLFLSCIWVGTGGGGRKDERKEEIIIDFFLTYMWLRLQEIWLRFFKIWAKIRPLCAN
jgi:hypothetical protein